MREEILAFVDSCNFDYTSIVHPKEAWSPRVEKDLHYKVAIAQMLKPKRILEIGIRAGYSAAAFLYQNPDATYVGMDLNLSIKGRGLWGGQKNFMHHATKMLGKLYPHATIQTYVMDSLGQEAKALVASEEPFDLIHVDGDHSEEGCLKDLQLAATCIRPGGIILADDFKENPPWNRAQTGVTAAVKKFTESSDWSYFALPSTTGEAVIQIPL